MKINFDKIFLSVLWLVTVLLALTFLMNIEYSFDIFSSEHWAYLSELQSKQISIKSGFFISLIAGLLVGIIGLYFIIRPRFRKIPMPSTKTLTLPSNVEQAPTNTQEPVKNNTKEQIPAQQQQQQQNSTPPVPQPDLVRPASPLSGVLAHVAPQRPATATTTTTATPVIKTPSPSFAAENQKISDIFEENGYIVKNCNSLNDLKSPAVAVGYDQSVWIGVTGESVSTVQTSVNELLNFFEDTLGENANEVTVQTCIIKPSDTEQLYDKTIKTFSTLEEFSEFMAQNKNIQPKDFERELFDAFSSYIDTVINYIGKQ